jgi:hypothetical protein
MILIRIALISFSILFGYLTYKNSDTIVVDEFMVEEKIESGLYLVHLENDTKILYQANESEYIKAREGDIFIVEELNPLFMLCIVISIIFFLVLINEMYLKIRK